SHLSQSQLGEPPMKTSAASLVVGLSSCFLLAASVVAQQQAAPKRQQDHRSDSPSLQAQEKTTQRDDAERDDPRARIQAQREELGPVTPEFKKHLLQQRLQRQTSRQGPDPNIVASSGPQWVPIGPTNTDYEQNGSFTGFVIDSGRARTILPDPSD